MPKLKKGKIVVWKDGTYKVVENGITWEYENDTDWLVTIPQGEVSVTLDKKKIRLWMENIGRINKETHQLEFDLFEIDIFLDALKDHAGEIIVKEEG